MTTAAARAPRRSRRRSTCPTGTWMTDGRAVVPAAGGQSGTGRVHGGGRGAGRAGPPVQTRMVLGRLVRAHLVEPAGAGRAGGGCMTCCACTPASSPAPIPVRRSGSRPGTGCWTTTLTGARGG